MPADNGTFTMTLSAKGVGDVATTQSGDYQVTIVASFVAEEKGNNTITADITATTTAAVSGLLTEIDTYSAITNGDDTTSQDDNSAWNDETSTSTLDTEQSPDVLSTTDGDTAAANATVY
jgi:hypothetical protein